MSAAARLNELNQASGKTNKFTVVAWNPFTEKYEYQWRGEPRVGENFMVTLVSPDAPDQYCLATIKKTAKDTTKFHQAQKTYTAGKTFQISKVTLNTELAKQYVSPANKAVVNLALTSAEPAVHVGDGTGVVQPCPMTTVAKCHELSNNQFFDVTALIQRIGADRDVQNDRIGFSVDIFDGSLDSSTQRVKLMPVTLYFDRTSDKAQTTRILLENLRDDRRAASFFCIQGSRDLENAFYFRSTRNTHIVKACGSKAEDLASNATLHVLRNEDLQVFQQRATQESRDWSQERGMEVTCKILAKFAQRRTNIQALDEAETIWQLNWVRVTEPAAVQDVKTNDGARIWFPLPMRDFLGQLTLYITERAALKLAKAADQSEFEKRHKEERLNFPMFATLKVSRKPRAPDASAAGSAAQPALNEFDCRIVDAEEQQLGEAPTTTSTKLLNLLDTKADSADAVLPGALRMIYKSEHYSLALKLNPQPVPAELAGLADETSPLSELLQPCGQIVALIASTERSKPAQNDDGYKIITDNVIDITFDGASDQKYRIISYCTLDNLTDFKLDPPKSQKSQAALISITSVLETAAEGAERPANMTFLVDSIQLLSDDEANVMKPVLRKMIYLATLAAQMSSRKRPQEPWSPTENPASAASLCRVLGRSPTAPPLPEYVPPP